MQARLEAQKASPAAYQAMLGLETFVRKQSKLEPALIQLVKMRASQINGCAYCIDMHSKDARSEGETEQRIYALSAWEETPFFTDRERAALALTEAITLVSQGHVPDAVYEKVRKSFSEEELVNLTLAIITINGWNRLAITFRMVVGRAPAWKEVTRCDRVGRFYKSPEDVHAAGCNESTTKLANYCEEQRSAGSCSGEIKRRER